VIKDAESGVLAAKAGEFAALGLARHDDEALLEGAGADIVVSTLDDIDLAGLGDGRLAPRAG
jgi:beta-phosphoglucomutase